ncbi:hypothetical protein BAUCODRAFT_232937 [Baudoinia panamericana UAMH 10762]|uniref:SPT2 chromatin protein n=1 Tax=Baudoinia panamericana (strain UAMH 10762) TaxID=717646 RepID=M2N2K6_BAUPA|nr:uncharacterized protein BAUCODRAFT_232937 [Baudoinia panamericana UAMH 10762]EMC93214.1 hypothetical protein BAUCODRAFT_232937 [Baudoinia panamericana UAMH 10762]
MTSFSSLISSLGDKAQAPATTVSSVSRPIANGQADRKPNGVPDRFKLTPHNAAAGVKRRSEEPEPTPRAKLVKTEQVGAQKPPTAPSNRFQLSSKPGLNRTSSMTERPRGNGVAPSLSPAKPVARSLNATSTPTPPGTADGSVKPKKGFASILEKAKAAQAAAQVTGSGGIKHKAVERLSRKERLRLHEEEMARQKAAKKDAKPDRSRSNTPNITASPGGVGQKKVVETSYKGTMKKPPADTLAYRGTMRAGGSGPKPAPKKGQPQDKYGGYASWSDLDDAEEEDEGRSAYDDYDSDDMEGGFDDVEAEEREALRAAKKEDEEALAEEERLRREKRRRLEALSKSAAAKRKF